MKVKFVEVEKSVRNGLWFATIDLYSIDGTYVIASASSVAVWETEELARDAGLRAEAMANETGKFPNMCEKW